MQTTIIQSNSRATVPPMQKPEFWDDLAREHNASGMAKYLHWDREAERWKIWLEIIGLDRMKPKRVLDISAGLGVFPALCKHYGHDAYATERLTEANRVCLDFLFSLGVETEGLHIASPRVVLPFRETNFDIITAFSCPPMSAWTLGDWDIFISHIMPDLKPGGFLFLAPNNSPGAEILYNFSQNTGANGNHKWAKIQKEIFA